MSISVLKFYDGTLLVVFLISSYSGERSSVAGKIRDLEAKVYSIPVPGPSGVSCASTKFSGNVLEFPLF